MNRCLNSADQGEVMRHIVTVAGVILLIGALAACTLGSSVSSSIPPAPSDTPTPHIATHLVVAVGNILQSHQCGGGNDQVSCERVDTGPQGQPCPALQQYAAEFPDQQEYWIVENSGDEPMSWFADITSGSIQISPASGMVPAHADKTTGQRVYVTFQAYTSYHIAFQTLGQQVDVSVDC
jgi:hypothetical protein